MFYEPFVKDAAEISNEIPPNNSESLEQPKPQAKANKRKIGKTRTQEAAKDAVPEVPAPEIPDPTGCITSTMQASLKKSKETKKKDEKLAGGKKNKKAKKPRVPVQSSGEEGTKKNRKMKKKKKAKARSASQEKKMKMKLQQRIWTLTVSREELYWNQHLAQAVSPSRQSKRQKPRLRQSQRANADQL